MNDMVTIPRAEYERLQEAATDLADLRAYDRVTADIDAGRDELLPAEMVERVIGGESPLRVWREHRGLSQSALAAASGVNRVQVADIEAGRRGGSVDTMKKLAAALGLAIDDLV